MLGSDVSAVMYAHTETAQVPINLCSVYVAGQNMKGRVKNNL